MSYFLALLAEIHGRVGAQQDGLTAGLLLLSLLPDDHTRAVACFERSLEVARHQHASSLELRAAVSLSRLWQQQGRLEAACQWSNGELDDAPTRLEETTDQ